MKQRLSVIIPVFNESAVLRQTVPTVLEAIRNADAEVVFVCNGTQDQSVQILKSFERPSVSVLELPLSGKANAINHGETLVKHFPRFYLDADVMIPPNALTRLAEVLSTGQCELASPRIIFDLSQANRLSRWITNTWTALPHSNLGAFHHLLGVSEAGRNRWETLPDIFADDAYIESQIPPTRRQIVDDVRVTTWAPAGYTDWLKVRSRWIQGHVQLRKLGIEIPKVQSQRRHLLLRLLNPVFTVPTIVYLSVRLLAVRYGIAAERSQAVWFHLRGNDCEPAKQHKATGIG